MNATSAQEPGDPQMTSVGPEIFPSIPPGTVRSPRQVDDLDRQSFLYPSEYMLRWTSVTGRHPLTTVRSNLPFPQGRRVSIAVVDWSALNNTCRLLIEPAAVDDPFTAILDLSTIVTALIYYDHLLVLQP